MRRVMFAAAALVLGTMGAVTSASAESAGTSACHTWQYKTKYRTLAENDYHNPAFHALQGSRFNVTSTLVVHEEYKGTLYDLDGHDRGRVWIDTAALDYQRCW